MKIWTCGSSPRSGSRNAWTRIENVNGASRLRKFWIFSARSKWFPVANGDHGRYLVISLWPEAKQKSKEWRQSGSFRPPKIPSAKIRWKSSRLDFLGSRRHPPHWLSSKWPNYQHGVLLISAGAIEGHFDGKTPAAGRSPRGSCSCTTMPRLTGHLHPRRNRPTWPSNVLIAHPILRIWPRRTTTCSLDWRKQLKFRHFSSDAEVIAATETWLDGQILIFLSGLQKLEQRAKKCIEIRGVCVEQIPSLVAVACFRSWSG